MLWIIIDKTLFASHNRFNDCNCIFMIYIEATFPPRPGKVRADQKIKVDSNSACTIRNKRNLKRDMVTQRTGLCPWKVSPTVGAG